MEFPQEYFEDQVIDGFYVPSIIKQLWGATLEVFEEFDRVCKKHNIPYFADWGTLLSAVRHGGFIPWDDDLDVSMMRQDYERFMQVAKYELKEGFEAYNYNDRDCFWQFIGCVIAKNRICLEEDHLKQFHNIPYMIGIDIFVLDYWHKDKDFREKQKSDFFAVYTLAQNIDKSTKMNHAVEMHLRHIEDQTGEIVDRKLEGVALKKRLYQLCEKIAGRCRAEDADEISQLIPHGFERNDFHFPKEAYKEMIRLPYEVTTIPVPFHYEKMLRGHYRNYVKPNKVWNCHDYPLIKIQRQNLSNAMNSDLLEYRFAPTDLPQPKEEGEEVSTGFKPVLVECYQGLQALLQVAFDATSDEDAVNALMESQQLAIDMGGLIESVKGEGTACVHSLEEYCEALYAVCQCGADMAILLTALYQIADSLNTEILSKKELLILISKASWWPYVEGLYNEYATKEGWDVTLLRTPYFYKNYDGTVRAMHEEEGEYPSDVILADSESYDIPTHHPDIIVTLNPFDRFNPETSVLPEYYSKALADNCEKLICLPPFDMDDFTPKDGRDYYNLADFLCMPGIMRANEVWVPSETLRQTYIQKLVEFTNGKYRSQFESKLVVKAECFPSRQGKAAVSEAEKEPITLVYYLSASYFVEHKEAGLDALQKNLSAVKATNKKILLILNGSLREVTQKYMPSLWKEIDACLSSISEEDGIKIISDDSVDPQKIVQSASGYYGDGSHIAMLFIREKKPVMLGNIKYA